MPMSPDGSSQPVPASAPMNPANLMGQPAAAPPAGMQDQLRNFMQQLQALDEQFGDIARQFPEFAESARKIKDEIKAGMLRVVGSAARGTEAPTLPLAV